MLALLQTIQDVFRRWWSGFALQTKLMAAATLVVSLLMSGLTFWAVNTIQQDARLNDTRFGRDLGLLLAANVAPLIAENNLTEVARFSSRFYQSTSSVRYLIYADVSGKIFFGIPFSDSQVKNSFTIERSIQLPENYAQNSEVPFVRQHNTPNGEVTDVFVPLNHEGKYLGALAIGINPNPRAVVSSSLTRDVTIAVFISIWAMVILGSVFNALTITRPIKELLRGVKNIAAGNFKQRIDLPLGGELGELISNFNEMAQKLKSYQEQNIEELTAEKAKLETLVSTIADGAVLIDNNMQIILVNQTARRLLGWETLGVINQNILHHLPDDVSVKLTKPLYHIASSEISKGAIAPPEKHEPESNEFQIAITHPTKRTLRILLTQVLDQYRDNVKGVAITIQDITREAELNEAKSRFIGNISHELRTPLFNIKSFIETLAEYGEELTHTQRQDFLDTANRETDRLTRLVNDVLDYTRITNKTYQLDSVDLAQLIEQTLRTYQINAKDKEIQLSQEIEAELPNVLGNYDLLLQVFNNLVSNALKFTKAKGQVVIRAYKKVVTSSHQTVEKVRIEISDTGIGIDNQDQEAIFVRFFRVENKVHSIEGTGIGLSIVKEIIDQHNTTINLVSEAGVGTTFWFDLLVYQEAEKISFLDHVNSGNKEMIKLEPTAN